MQLPLPIRINFARCFFQIFAHFESFFSPFSSTLGLSPWDLNIKRKLIIWIFGTTGSDERMWTLSTFTCLTHSPPRPPTMNSKIFTNPFFHCDGGREIWAHFSACPHSFVVTGSIFGGAGGCSRDQITMHFFGSHMLEHFFPPARRSSKSTELLHSCKSKTAKVGVSTHTPPAQLQVFFGFL